MWDIVREHGFIPHFMIAWQPILLSLLPPVLLLLLGGMALFSRQVYRPVAWRWLGALLALALWSSQLTSYGAAPGLPPGGAYSWRLAAGYMLPLAGLGVLWTTTRFLGTHSRLERVGLGLGLLLFAVALLLDPALLWRQPFTPLLVAGARLRQFDLWAGVWGAAWLVPLLTALVLTLQAARRLPPSLYRGQVRYWLLLLAGLLLLTPPALLHDPGQPLWQSIAVAGMLLCGSIGTASLTNRRLPDFRFTARQLLRGIAYWLGGTLLIWGGLQLLAAPGGRRRLDNPVVLLALAAGMALLFLLLRQLLSAAAARLLRPIESALPTVLPVLDGGSLGDPAALGEALCSSLRASLGVDDIWLAAVIRIPDRAELRITPLTDGAPEGATFSALSSFGRFLETGERPLVRIDLETLPIYQALPPGEQQILHGWERELLVAIAAANRPVALLGLGPRRSGDGYAGSDLRHLQQLADQVAPLLNQAAVVAELQRAAQASTAAGEALTRERDQLLALLTLYRQALALATPDLRAPLAEIDAAWSRLARSLSAETETADHDISLPLAQLKLSLGALLNAYGRLLQQPLQPVAEPILIGGLCQETFDALQAMAAARRVTLTLETAPGVAAFSGSPPLLREALRQLVHNAIKFNKIGGAVAVRCVEERNSLRIDVEDNGVGMTPERLATLGTDLGSLLDGDRPVIHLGVALARYAALAHGGRLEAASTYGAGSTLSLFLPLPETENVSNGRGIG